MTTYSAVGTTGIYCRPGCSARPNAENVVTFELAAAAEVAGYRACLKCRPYRVADPVAADSPELICRAVQLVLAGTLDDNSEGTLGARLGVSARHLRRMFNDHLGVTPTQLARSRRAHFARRLLDDTDLTVTQIAFGSGFGSIRHFNRTMQEVFRASPRHLRERRRRHDRLVADGGLALRMPHTHPFDWVATLRFLAARAIPGVEAVDETTYRRTIVLDGHPGVLEIQAGGVDHLVLRAHLPYWEGLIHVVERVSRIVGSDVGTDAEAFLANDPILATIVRRQPGLRTPGAWGPFEIAVHAAINEHLDLEATRDAMGSIVRRHGLHIPGLSHGLSYAFPAADTLARADLIECGISDRVSAAVLRLASAVASKAVRLEDAAGLHDLVTALTTVGGISATSAHHVALRLGHHDAFPVADKLLTSALSEHMPSATSIANLAEAWRPHRALASTHLIAYNARHALG